jgi:hypothetical protein
MKYMYTGAPKTKIDRLSESLHVSTYVEFFLCYVNISTSIFGGNVSVPGSGWQSRNLDTMVPVTLYR